MEDGEVHTDGRDVGACHEAVIGGDEHGFVFQCDAIGVRRPDRHITTGFETGPRDQRRVAGVGMLTLTCWCGVDIGDRRCRVRDDERLAAQRSGGMPHDAAFVIGYAL
ncbi:hypothetical protein D514_0104105 [Microbacterium sp. UCD-TDU]|nr:hypothetical protein D514_0104105 [Microbacterium sp. UCD-TDU]